MQSDMPSESATPQSSDLQHARTLRQTIVIGLLAFSLLILLLALYLISLSVQNDIARSEANLTLAQTQLLRLHTPEPAVQELLTTLTETVALADTLAAVRPPTGIDWPAIVPALMAYNPTDLTLTTLLQVDQRLTLTGAAVNDVTVVDYVRTLERSPLFTDVVLESIVLLTPTPAPTQAATATAASSATLVNFVITIGLRVEAP